jgi:poly-gamma-glutamate synthesis protein (capsule biosynthesis protein)
MKKRRRKLKIKNISIFLILIIIAIISTVKLSNKNSTFSSPKEVIIPPKEDSITLVMAGDALINDLLYNDAKRDDGYDFKPYLTLIKEKIKDYDLAYYNQETILGGSDIGVSSYPSFNSPYEVGDAMIDAGFDIVSLATNHTLDRGKKAIINSRNYWNSKEGIYAIGSYSSSEEKELLESRVFNKNNITYGVLNYTYGTNGIKVPNGENYLVNLWDVNNNYEGYKENVLNDIKKLRDKVDVLIVAMHWGIEYTHTPVAKQKEMAKFLAENGVDIIIGTHPHVIEPIEYINNTLVFYSLGNFISSQTSDSCTNYKCNIGLLSSLKITKTTDGIKIDNVMNELIYTYNKNHSNYLVVPFSNEKIAEYLPNYQEVYNNYANIINSDDERIKTVPLAS